jgi:hypothetical protein
MLAPVAHRFSGEVVISGATDTFALRGLLGFCEAALPSLLCLYADRGQPFFNVALVFHASRSNDL